MALADDVRRLLIDYPRIYFACHTRHVADPRTGAALSATLASILDHLDDMEGIAVSDLAAHLGVTVSTMSLNLDRLEQRGYARRVRDPADGRRSLVRITRAGLRLREAKSVLDPALVRNLLRQLAPARRAEAMRGMSLLADAAAAGMRRAAATRSQRAGRRRTGKNVPVPFSEESSS